MLCKTSVMFVDAYDNWLARVSISGSNKDDRGHVRCSEESDCDTSVMLTDACDNWLARISISGSNKDDRGRVRCSEESDCDARGL